MRLAPLLFVLLFACQAHVGDTCESTNDCDHIRAGYCATTGICVANCANVECEEGLCMVAGARSVCLPFCESDEECRSGETCTSTEGGSACLITDPLAEP
jgi:hypothetical protein